MPAIVQTDHNTHVIYDRKSLPQLYHALYTEPDLTTAKAHQEIYNEVNQAVGMRNVQTNTLRRFGREWVTNTLQNMQEICRWPQWVEMKANNVPAIIIGAGTSLRDQLELIETYRDKAVILGGARTLELLDHDVTVVLDSQYKLLTEFRTETKGFWLYGAHINPAWYRLKDEKYVCAPDGISDLFGVPAMQMGAGVSNTTSWIAWKMGCNPIILVGHDMVLREDGLWYAGTQKLLRPGEEAIPLPVRGVDGSTVTMQAAYAPIKQWFDNFKPEDGTRLVNATTFGVDFRGWEHMGLDEAMNLLPARGKKRLQRPKKGRYVDFQKTKNGMRACLKALIGAAEARNHYLTCYYSKQLPCNGLLSQDYDQQDPYKTILENSRELLALLEQQQ